ncbi:MAG: biotin-dependent carboxyltransferase family protein [Caldisericia bacterium]|nr:biotin-dependent carboxyltransferase family protein [Caldisericia bacterium]
MIKVLEEGFYSIIVDLGREKFLRFGISPSGEMDEYSFRIGNIFLNNNENTPQIEITLKGPTLEFLEDKIIFLTGGEIEAKLNGEEIQNYEPIYVKKGSILSLGYVKKGFRSYLITQGGVVAKKFLGSASFDKFLNKGIKLKKETVLEVGKFFDKEVLNRKFDKNYKIDLERKTFRVILGPDLERFKDESIDIFLNENYKISEKSDRVAIRLEGIPLKIKENMETIISEGVSTGTIQVPKSGEPIILLKDRPTTGGYPKIGNIIKFDIPSLSQKRLNELINFKSISLKEAHSLLKEREEKISKFKESLNLIKKFYIILKDKKYFCTLEEIKNEEHFN